MKKILINIKCSFSFKSNSIKYKKDISVYFSFLFVYSLIYLLVYCFDKHNEYNTGIILGIILIIYLYQSLALFYRLIKIKENKKDEKFLTGNYKFICEPVEINYKDLKKILQKTTEGFKLYCDSFDNKKHIIEVKALVYKWKYKKEIKYYFDKAEYVLEKVLMLINEKQMIVNSKVTILGNNVTEEENFEIIEYLLKKYK